MFEMLVLLTIVRLVSSQIVYFNKINFDLDRFSKDGKSVIFSLEK